MGSDFKINENLVNQLSLLATGSSCVALGGLTGGAVIAFGVFAAPAVGIGAWGVSKWMKRYQTKDPKSYRTIQKIKSRINETLAGDSRFAEMDNDAREFADKYLSKLLSDYWPAPKMIVELARDMDGFPKAIADHILDEINGANLSGVPDHFFEDGDARDYAEKIITIALNSSLQDADYFKTLQPEILMQNLKLTGQIKRDVGAFIEKLAELKHYLGEKLDRIEDKVDQVLTILRDGKTASQYEQDYVEKTVREMLSSERQATQDAVKAIMADPPNPVAATNRLKQAIAEQSDARAEATSNEIEMWQEIATINYFINGEEAVKAYNRIIDLDPNDAESCNQLGNLQLRLGDLDAALSAYKRVLKIANTRDNDELHAVSFGNMGIVAQTRGDLDAAMDYYGKALALHEALGSKKGMAANYGNMGNVAQTRGDLDSAMDYYAKSLEIEKALNRKEGMASDYGNMGNVAQIRGDLDAAMDYHSKALALNEALGRKEGMANNYGNMGNVAQIRGDLDAAMNYYAKAMALYEALGSKEGMANQYGNMGIVAKTRGDIDGAMDYYGKALELNEALGRKEGMANNYGNMGKVAETRGDLGGARGYWQKSLNLFTEIGAGPQIALVESWLKTLDT
ncbi:tetratricopeptide repeat protein [Robiginitomaculum antarcticum]|uniref:tetratricopeptide repeat protein n=1 Tax=Robiginitomaculum antarcticum TaxID=437507 RepID=UPI00039B54B2|nr:tetratricopeptide repeat protein [Robiginitomaculum antarcticum]